MNVEKSTMAFEEMLFATRHIEDINEFTSVVMLVIDAWGAVHKIDDKELLKVGEYITKGQRFIRQQVGDMKK